jgi:site-specific recombinase XerD
MLLSDYVSDFLSYMAHEKGARATTLKGYQSQLRHFIRWMIENGYTSPTLSDLSTPVIRRYLYHHCNRKGANGKVQRPRSVRSYFHCLRSLGDWLVENSALTTNVFKSVLMPSKGIALRLTVSDECVCHWMASPCTLAFP